MIFAGWRTDMLPDFKFMLDNVATTSGAAAHEGGVRRTLALPRRLWFCTPLKGRRRDAGGRIHALDECENLAVLLAALCAARRGQPRVADVSWEQLLRCLSDCPPAEQLIVRDPRRRWPATRCRTSRSWRAVTDWWLTPGVDVPARC